MNLAIDLGNTSAKIGFFEGETAIKVYSKLAEKDILTYIKEYNPTQAIICSVSQDPVPLQQQLQLLIPTVYVLTHQLPLPLCLHYDTPHTLGTDRIAAVAGAKALYPQKNCLVIDIGTCITYDFADEQNNYWGGSISPGLYMRLKALHTFTARLPLLEPEANVPLTGTNTKDAILSGVINGIVAEIRGIIEEYHKKFNNFYVIFCGGDSPFFESKIKESIFVVPELVLIGLNRILRHNVSKN